nr:hypothetical protein [Candidatus Eremiobacteraeota bacterium]
ATSSPVACPSRAVFIRFDAELRGYPLDAHGVTSPCARISGPRTQLVERGPLAVSVHGYLHSLNFQSSTGYNGLTIHAPNANGNVAPVRMAGVDQDYVALAVDSSINDYIVANQGYEGEQCWYIVANDQHFSNRQNCDTNINAVHALATNLRDELVVVGNEVGTGEGRIDIYDHPASTNSRLVRTIKGEKTGLASLSGTLGYFDVTYSLATDPRSGAIYVYDHLFNFLGGGTIPGAGPAKISEFAACANGNVAPQRVLSGPSLNLVDYAFGVNELAVDDRGELYSLSRGAYAVVNVFGPQARGNAPPLRTFVDRTAVIGSVGASIAVRTHESPGEDALSGRGV